MSFFANTKDELRTGCWIPSACVALILFNAAGLLAGYHWLPDLFVNFKLSYLLASLVLAVFAFCFKRRRWAIIMLALAGTIVLETQFAYTSPFGSPPAAEPNLTIVQYNKYYYEEDISRIDEWLRQPDSDFDVVVLNESNPEILDATREQLSLRFPHQFPKKYLERFNDISVLSKWPFTIEAMPMRRGGTTYNISKITLSKDGLPPVTVYAYHTQTPVGPNDAALRNFELETFAATVRADKQSRTMMLGDWNVTPWSPHFKNMLSLTRMNYQNYGLLPQATFPAYTRFNLLQMPIDHILFDDHFDLVSISKGPSLSSDHHSLIARLHVKPE